MLSTPSICMSQGVAPAFKDYALYKFGVQEVGICCENSCQPTAECGLAVGRYLAVVSLSCNSFVDCVTVWVVVVACVWVEPGFVVELVFIVIAFFDNLVVVKLADAVVVVNPISAGNNSDSQKDKQYGPWRGLQDHSQVQAQPRQSNFIVAVPVRMLCEWRTGIGLTNAHAA